MTELKITPPPELVEQWWDDFNGAFYEFEAITATVFQAGADQELEACCEWMMAEEEPISYINALRAARRPKPPSLKELALEALAHILNNSSTQLGADTIRRALEQLPDNEWLRQ
jgi:hypothetical protein